MKKLVQVRGNRWETPDGEYIVKDDFGSYRISCKEFYEITNSFEKAVRILNSEN